jgi:digeranylgeranylglycerophospholipid reductase
VDYDVVVVGAGPGGSMTAKHLAEKGINVLLVEKRPEIGVPVRCGEATGMAGLKELGIKVNKKFIACETSGACLYSPNGTKVEMPSKKPNGYVLERRIFDKYLAIAAAKSGAEVRVGTYATGLIKEDGFVRGVKLKHFNERYEVECDVVVGADGIESKVGRWAGINTRTKLSQMISNAQFEMADIELEDPTILEFYFGNKIAPKGYVWIFPKGSDVANVGLGVRDPNKTALEYLNEFVDSKEELQGGSVVEINVGGVPVQGPIEKSVTDGVLLVGDAARQIDPLTGGGIYNAMHCGVIASEVISEAIEHNDFSEKFLMTYDKRWRESIGKSLERSLKVKNVLERMSDKDLNLVAKALQDIKLGDIDIKDVTKVVFRMPKEFIEFVKTLI